MRSRKNDKDEDDFVEMQANHEVSEKILNVNTEGYFKGFGDLTTNKHHNEKDVSNHFQSSTAAVQLETEVCV